MKAQTGGEMMKAIPDLVLMSELSENEMFKVLKRRLEDKRIYTYIGEVCISVNPYTTLPIYGPERIKEHSGMYMYQLEPHVYAVAENMYRELRSTRENQCVLVSGESGAGKTEASKKIMEYVAAVSPEGAGVARIKTMLLDSNPILEAFGNAKTLRNDNSSRFGKYMEISFDFAGAPQGGRISNYLLEKVRVTQRNQGERAFHIFYQLLAGMSDGEAQQLQLTRNPDDYDFLKKSQCHTVPGMNDKMEFKKVCDAMRSLDINKESQGQIWSLLAAILTLGNIQFGPEGGRNADKSIVTNRDVVRKAAQLLHVKPEGLDAALTSRTIKTGNQAIKTPLNVVDALASRDAFAKSLYSGLFDWIVQELNRAMAPKNQVAGGKVREMTLGVLDIYGFEIFDDNSFEQFCINWCNEKLQQYFIELTLKLEQEEYAREGIQWTPVEYFDNRIILDLIEKKPGGILSILDEDCLLATATDMSFLEKLSKNVGSNKHFKSQATEQKSGVKGAGKLNRENFTLVHYAGEVSYKVSSFIEKNRDILFNDQVVLINGSTDKLVSVVFKNVNTDSMKRPDTAGTKFKSSLAALVDTLSKCRPHYVRCIKPNEDKAALKVDEERFRHQLRYLGLLENVRVRRAGFCFRQTYERFLARYKPTCPTTWPQWRGNAKAGAEELLRHHKVPKDQFRLGKTKVFIKDPQQLFALEEARDEMLPTVAIMIQRQWRGAIQRMRYKRLLAALKIQRAFRRWKSKKWVALVIKTFKGVSAANNYGMSIAWPATPPAMQLALGHMKRIQRTWRGTDIIRQVPEQLRPIYRQKVKCFDLFRNQKPWDCKAPFVFDHLANEAVNNFSGNYKRVLGEINGKFADGTKVVWSDNGEKMLPNQKWVPRNIIVTQRAVYKLANYKLKQGIALTEVTKISLSKHNDSLVVIHNSTNRAHVISLAPRLACGAPAGGQNDAVQVQGLGKERYSEFLVVFLEAVAAAKGGQVPPVEFVDSVSFNAAKKPGSVAMCTLQFQQSANQPPTTVTKGKPMGITYSE